MTAAAELIHLRHEKRVLREQASVQRELITREQEQITLLERELSLHQEQMAQFAEQVKALQERLAKASHTRHLPPSSDRFGRQPKSLRQKSAKKPGGQEGQPGKTLLFSPCPDEVIEALLSSSVIHQDETGLYVTGQRQWMHVTCTPTLTPYGVHASRGHEAWDAIGSLPRFGGTSVHDGWRSYFLYACAHALCLVHLVRELTCLAEEQGLEWAADLKALVLEMKEATDEAREQGLATLHPLAVEEWHAQFVALVAHADAMTPTAQAPPGTKGRAKQSAARTLLDRLIHTQQAVLAFLHRLGVPFDNTQAQRHSRMLKVQHKVSGSFRSEAAATAFCRIRGYVSTLRKQGLDLLASLEATLRGHPILPSFQTTWVVTSNLCATQG